MDQVAVNYAPSLDHRVSLAGPVGALAWFSHWTNCRQKLVLSLDWKRKRWSPHRTTLYILGMGRSFRTAIDNTSFPFSCCATRAHMAGEFCRLGRSLNQRRNSWASTQHIRKSYGNRVLSKLEIRKFLINMASPGGFEPPLPP